VVDRVALGLVDVVKAERSASPILENTDMRQRIRNPALPAHPPVPHPVLITYGCAADLCLFGAGGTGVADFSRAVLFDPRGSGFCFLYVRIGDLADTVREGQRANFPGLREGNQPRH